MSDNEVALENIEPSNRIIVKSLNFETDENGLREYFSKYGTVTAAEIAVNKSQNKSLGYGFVTFSSVEEATKANDQSIVHELDDRVVRTNFAKKRSNEKREGHGIKKLYIGKLPLQVNEKELKEYFGQFGKVSDAFISTVKYAPELNGYEQHKGYGFVTFESAEDANKAVKQESHVFKNESIFVKKAIPQSNEKSPKERRNKGDRNNNKGGRRNNNEGRRNNNEGRRNNKEGSSPSSQGKSSDSQQDSTSSSSVGEKKAVVVKRKEDTKPEGSSSSTSSTTTTTTQTTTTKSTNKPTNTTSSNNNKGKIVVNQAPKTTIVISKNPVNPWTKSQTGGSQSQASDEYPTLSGGKKKSNVKKTTTTTTVTTTIINEKDDKEEN